MYQDDLAYIQHHGFSAFATAASPGLLGILRHGGITSGHVLDLGCGDGTWLRALTDEVLSASGIDQSASLVDTRGAPRQRQPSKGARFIAPPFRAAMRSRLSAKS